MTDKTIYIYDKNSNSYFEVNSNDLEQNMDEDNKKTAYIFDNKNQIWTGFPIKIAYQILIGKLTKEDFLNKIKDNLIMLK